MTERPLKNVAASVRQRLMNSAKASGRPFQEVLQYFAMERFLYHLSQSPHAERFILKGALLFNLWGFGRCSGNLAGRWCALRCGQLARLTAALQEFAIRSSST